MRRFLVVAGVAVAITAAGCGTTTATPSLEKHQLTAAEVLQQTAQKTDKVTSYAADVVMNISGPNGESGSIEGTVRTQSAPKFAIDASFDKINFGGQNAPGGMRMILDGDVAYMKMEMLQTLMGGSKPWIKIDLKKAGAQAGLNLDELLGQASQMDLKTNTKMLTASKDIKVVGDEKVGGVDTTHYAGTYPMAEALKQLPAEAQKQLKTQMSGMKDTKFDVWIDGDGLPRKMAMKIGQAQAGAMDMTMLFKSFNEKLAIKAPPAGQVGELPTNVPLGA
ncbi:LolA-like protein [Planotetraspora mira]|uniref:Putative lipoprotein n=1 Tax=Planotetraspora mira TaxID=58121 RepID=A0A8J3TNY9_9ACTN|nr:LppX_LprAFG lipoprotein [Planotetraspora mira]GII29426.1 putative lipoprotein [Planotetraspora mira]